MRMIDADALAEAMGVNRLMIQSWKADSAWGVPIVDAEPVVHGKWREIAVDNRIVYCCTVCYTVANMPNPATFGLYDYCPHCGAKMDGGADNETV